MLVRSDIRCDLVMSPRAVSRLGVEWKYAHHMPSFTCKTIHVLFK